MAFAGEEVEAKQGQEEAKEEQTKKLLSSYLGISFSLFLAFLPNNSLSLMPNLQTQIRDLSMRLFQAEEQLKQMKSRRQEDSKANARVVEIFASHRNAWQVEEKRLLHQIDAASEEMAVLRAKVEDLEREKGEWQQRIQDLEREVGEREEMIGFMSRSADTTTDFVEEVEEESGGCRSREWYGGDDENNVNNFVCSPQYHQQQQEEDEGSNGAFRFSSDFLASASKFWNERATLWQVCSKFPLLFEIWKEI